MNFSPLNGLTKKQEEILKDINVSNKKFSIIKGSRQAGKSVLLQHALMMFACGKSYQIGAFISPSHSQSKRIYDSLLAKLPSTMVKKSINSDSDRHIILVNDTKIEFRSSKNYDAIRGSSYDFIVLDEFSFIDDIAWNSVIKQTIAAKKYSRVIAASTPLGRNLFYRFYTAGLAIDNNRYRSYNLHYSDNPYYDIHEVQQAKLELPTAIYLQEYEAEFVFGNSAVFGEFAQYQKVNIWDYEAIDNKEYFYGLDWAGDGSDSSVLTIIDNDGKVVYIYEPTDNNMVNQVSEILPIIRKYRARGYSETNGLGKGATDMLMAKYNQVYRFVTSNESKQTLVKELIIAMNEGIIKLPSDYLCNKLDNQMATYQANRTKTGKITYSHSLGCHDDYIDSLLLANHARINLSGAIGLQAMNYDDYYYDEIDYENEIYKD